MAHPSKRNPTGNTTQQRAPPTGGSGEGHGEKNRYLNPTPSPIHDHEHDREQSKHEVMGREHDLHESTQVALGVQELDACTLREELQRAAGMLR